MDHKFISSLPEELENVDFRVIADEGGYSVDIIALYNVSSGTLTVNAQRDDTRVFLRVAVKRNAIARDGNLFCFDGFIGELMDRDGHGTGNYVRINQLSIDPKLVQEGQTVGVLKMKQISRLSEAM